MNAAQMREHRMKQLEEFRSNSLKFGGPIGFVVSRSFDLCETVIRDGIENYEAVTYALESLEREREYALSKDQNLNDPLRSMIYNITQAISIMIESVLDEARARQGKALIAPVETPASSTSDFNVAGGSASVSPVQKTIKQEVITIEDAPGTSRKEEIRTEIPLYMAPQPPAQPPRPVHFSHSPPTPQAIRKSVISAVHPTKSATPTKSASQTKSSSPANQPIAATPVVKQQSPVTASPSATPSPAPSSDTTTSTKRASPAEEKPSSKTDADVPRPPKRKCTSSFYGYYEDDEESRSPTIIPPALEAAVPFNIHQCDKCDKSFDSLKGLKRHRFNHIAIKCSSCHRFVAKEKIDAHMERHAASLAPINTDVRDAMHSDDLEYMASDGEDDKDYRPAGVSAKPRPSTIQKRTEKAQKTEAPASPEAVIPADPVARKRPSPVPVVIPPPPAKDHVCGQCGKAFETVGKLATHELMHNEDLDQRFQCPHCKISRPKKSILNHHIRVDHGINPYDCRTCGETFAKKAHLKEHSIKESHGKYAKQSQSVPVPTTVQAQVPPQALPQAQPQVQPVPVQPQPVEKPVEPQPKPQPEARAQTITVEIIKVPGIVQPVVVQPIA